MQGNNIVTAASLPSQHIGLCCNCGRGLPYETYYIWCLFCDLYVCADCKKLQHPATHQPYYKYLLDRRTARGSMPSQTLCTKCKRTSHCGLSCNDCEFNLCVNCVLTSHDLIANHVHGNMTVTRAPDDFGLALYSTQCDGCRAGATLSHCGRCFNGIRKGRNFWTCVTCITEYNAQIRFCEDCQGQGQKEHDATHRFSSFLYQVNITKEPKYNVVKCLDCKAHVPFSGRELARHPHSRFQLIMGEAERDRRYFNSYRVCPRKPVRDVATVAEDAHGIVCCCCNRKSPMHSKVFMCPTCTMITCETCAEIGGARSHPHIMFPVSLQWTIPPIIIGQNMTKPDTPVKACAKCDKSVVPYSDSFIQCNHCEEWVICLECTKKTNIPVRHACAAAVEMTFFDPIKQINNGLIAQLLMAQKAKIATPTAAISSPQSPIALQQSFSIKRKSPSSRLSSLTSSISPVMPVPVSQQSKANLVSGIPQLPAPSSPVPQLAIDPKSLHTPTNDVTPAKLPIQQEAAQQIVYTYDPKHKAIQPIKKAVKQVSHMINEVDKDTWTKMGKQLGAFTAAVGEQATRQYIKNETGITLPHMIPTRKPTKMQNQALNAQLQQEKQELNMLIAQLKMREQMMQLQNQAVLQQQQQQQQVQNQAALLSGMPNLSGINPALLAQLSLAAQLNQPLSLNQGTTPVLQNQTTPISPSGTQPASSVHSIHSGSSTPILSSAVNVPMNIQSPVPSNIAPIPLSEQTVVPNMTANSTQAVPSQVTQETLSAQIAVNNPVETHAQESQHPQEHYQPPSVETEQDAADEEISEDQLNNISDTTGTSGLESNTPQLTQDNTQQQTSVDNQEHIQSQQNQPGATPQESNTVNASNLQNTSTTIQQQNPSIQQQTQATLPPNPQAPTQPTIPTVIQTATGPAQPAQPQTTINLQTGVTNGNIQGASIPAVSPSPVQAQAQTQQLDLQDPQVLALLQRIQEMNQQQQQQQQQLQLLAQMNQGNPPNQLIEQLYLQQLLNQTQQGQQGQQPQPQPSQPQPQQQQQQQQGGNQSTSQPTSQPENQHSLLGSGLSILDSGLSIINNLTHNKRHGGNHSGGGESSGNNATNDNANTGDPNNDILLQQQQLQLQQQQQQLQFQPQQQYFMNYSPLQNQQLNTNINNTLAMDDTSQVNFQLDALNNQLAALNNMEMMSSPSGFDTAASFTDFNVNLDGQSFDLQSLNVQGQSLDMQPNLDINNNNIMGFDSTSVFMSDGDSVQNFDL